MAAPRVTVQYPTLDTPGHGHWEVVGSHKQLHKYNDLYQWPDIGPLLAWNLLVVLASNGTLSMEQAMLIYLDDYRKAKAVKASGHRCDEELLCVNWNPAFRVIALSCFQSPQELSPALPDDFAAIEPAFLNRVYALASQI